MVENTDSVRRKPTDPARLDETDRKLLGLLAEDSTRQLLKLKELPEVEEIHTVTGDSAMVLKVRTRNTQSLEHFFERIYAIEGFKGTRSYVVLSTYLERGPSPQGT
jgi:DNA-binding Lrp family transcriptional regulator